MFKLYFTDQLFWGHLALQNLSFLFSQLWRYYLATICIYYNCSIPFTEIVEHVCWWKTNWYSQMVNIILLQRSTANPQANLWVKLQVKAKSRSATLEWVSVQANVQWEKKNPCTVEIRNKLQATHTQAKTMLSDHNDGDMSNSFSGIERNTTQYELCSSYIRNTHVNSNRNWSQRTIIVLTTKFLLSSQQHFQTAFMTHVLSFRCSRSKDVLWKDVSKMTGQGWTTILQFPFIL